MKTSENIADATLSLFEAGDLPFLFNPCAGIMKLFEIFKRARQIFASGLKKRLRLALASLCALFKPIYQKFDTRRMYEINGS